MNILEKIIIKFHQYRFRFMFGKRHKNGSVFGSFSVIHPDKFIFDKGLALNNYCYINATEGVVFGKKVAVSAGAKILSIKLNFENHQQKEGPFKHVGACIRVGNNVQIGSNAVILPGVSICDNVIIGANAVVSKDITESGIYVGTPVKKIS